MTGRYTGTRGDAGWTACWECKRPHDEHRHALAGDGGAPFCWVTAVKLDPEVCRELAAWALGVSHDPAQWTALERLRPKLEDVAARLTAAAELSTLVAAYFAALDTYEAIDPIADGCDPSSAQLPAAWDALKAAAGALRSTGQPAASPAAQPHVVGIGPADTVIIDQALGFYSSDYNDAPHADIKRIRAALTGGGS